MVACNLKKPNWKPRLRNVAGAISARRVGEEEELLENLGYGVAGRCPRRVTTEGRKAVFEILNSTICNFGTKSQSLSFDLSRKNPSGSRFKAWYVVLHFP